jgi:hypothetical protein
VEIRISTFVHLLFIISINQSINIKSPYRDAMRWKFEEIGNHLTRVLKSEVGSLKKRLARLKRRPIGFGHPRN